MPSGRGNIRDVLYNSVLCQGNVALYTDSLAMELHHPFASMVACERENKSSEYTDRKPNTLWLDT